MLRRLEIENYGLIARAEIAFSDAATMFTGETGSGKTMIFGALAFALGARANADVVRRGSTRTVVTLAFEANDDLTKYFAESGFELDAGEEATILREMNESGKSSVRLNGRATTASNVREISGRIVEMVGQHEAQRLLDPAYHLDLLDRYGGDAALRARENVSDAYAQLTHSERALAALLEDEQKARERYADARYAQTEIEAAVIEVDEDRRLTERRRFLDNLEHIVASLRAAHEALAGDEGSSSAAFGAAGAALESIAAIDESLHEMAASAASLQAESSELAIRVARKLDDTEYDPAQVEAINARLDLLDGLKRKYGGTLESVLERARLSRSSVEEHELREERAGKLRAAVAAARALLDSRAAELTAIRKRSAVKLARAVASELKGLALDSACFDVALTALDRIGSDGAEKVELAFGANAGEPLRPLARVASGGELSRLLLAVVVVLASVRSPSALIFDEIDAGVGGATATAVGARVGRLARDGQVLCVTHLAQLATWADRHYLLEKHESKGATTISVREIEGDEERTAELARMLSGHGHDAALAHARSLLHRVAEA